MVQKISIQMTLQGVEEIGKQLSNLGNVGLAAFAGMARGAEKATKEISNLPPQLQKIEQSFNKLQRSAAATLGKIGDFKVGNLATSFGRVESAAGSMVTRLALISGATAAAGAGFLALVNSATAAADNLQEIAAGAGVSAQAFQALSNVAADSGIGPEKLAQALGLLAKNMESSEEASEKAADKLRESREAYSELASSGKATAEGLRRASDAIAKAEKEAGKASGPLGQLGISVRDTMGNLKGADTVLLELADAFQKMPDGAKKTAIGLELFGRGGRLMVDMLNKGSEGIREFAAAMAAVGFTAEQFDIGSKFQAQQLVLTTALTGIRNQIGIAFAPGVGGIIKAFTDRIVGNFLDFRIRMAAIAKALEPVFADIANAVRGTGEAPTTELGAQIIAGFDRIKGVALEAGRIVAGAFGLMRAAAAGAASVINGVFGGNISGDALLAATAVLKVTGALGLMTAAIGLAASSLRLLLGAFGLVRAAAIAMGLALAAAFGIPAASLIAPILLALGALVLAFVATNEKAQEIFGQMMDGLLEVATAGAKKAWDTIVAVLSTPGDNVFSWIAADFNKFWKSVLENQRRGNKQALENIRARNEVLKEPLEMQGPPDLRSIAEKEAFLIKQEVQLDTKKAQSAFEKFVGVLQKIFGATMEEIEKMFPGITEAVTKATSGLKTALDPAKTGFGEMGAAARTAGQDIATAMQQAETAVDSLVDRQREQERSTQEGIEGIKDQIEQLRLQSTFETDPRRRAEMELRVRQLNDERKRREAAAQEQEQQHQRERANLQAEQALRLKLLQDEARAREQARRDREREARGGKPERSPFLPFEQQQPEQQPGKPATPAGGLDAIKAKAEAVKEAISQLGQQMAALPLIKWDTLLAGGQSAVDQLKAMFTIDLSQFLTMDFGNIISNAFNAAQSVTAAFSNIDIASALNSQLDTLINKFNELARSATGAASAAASVGDGGGGGGGGAVPFATGGLFRGRPGRDTNLAWLSNMEYVMRPEAVRKYGVGLMHMINSMQFPGFAMGGLNLRVPAYAVGGAARAGNTRVMHLTIGDQTFRNLVAPESTAKQLERASIIRQTSSTGIKPSWKR